MGEIYWSADNIGTIAGFFSADECDAYIRLGEATGFEEAPITTSRGMIMMKDVRNNDRVVIDDPARAQASISGSRSIWRRASRTNGRRSG